ncbi:L-ribulose-5-phosphate 4-epimerase [Acidipila sp. EB88]|uniref:L-ribulose-5-phosphate 4-epimerase n=1 Tax=Acidipila sp. EB88 TaxID=2305226 RepID=UPI000F5F949E|nr:L-ribulose-5-phosphate 4-epimerase [Acidipila sp. EB88]RRA48935.1 L-ribulose-5-phosphate 4-epimerase [Acidipila sp. EB88]
MLERLKEEVLAANLDLVKHGLVIHTWGNCSGIDREQGLVVIKPSGVPYSEMRAEDMVVTDMDGEIVEGSKKPSSDLGTHLLLYTAFENVGGVVHTHSEYATAWSQAARPIPPFGTTHADYFYGAIPVTEELSTFEIKGDYVHNTGLAITRRFRTLDPDAIPGVLVAGHAPFAWGTDAHDAVHNAVVLEAVAKMAWVTLQINPNAKQVSQSLLDRHYFRKHGENATYGQ